MNELAQFLTSHAGVVLFLAILAEQIGIPLPAAPVLVASGALAADGGLSPVMAIAITVAACAPGDLIWYYAGRRRGNRMLQFLRKIFPGDRSFSRSEHLFTKYGMAAVAGAKFVPGVSFVIPALAGAFRIHFGRFVWFDVLGSLLYGFFYIQLGSVFSHEISGAIKEVGEWGFWTAMAALLAAAVFVAHQHVQTRKAGKTQSGTGANALMTTSEA